MTTYDQIRQHALAAHRLALELRDQRRDDGKWLALATTRLMQEVELYGRHLRAAKAAAAYAMGRMPPDVG